METYLFILRGTDDAPVAVEQVACPDGFIGCAHKFIDFYSQLSLDVVGVNHVCCCEVWQYFNHDEMKKIITVF